MPLAYASIRPRAAAFVLDSLILLPGAFLSWWAWNAPGIAVYALVVAAVLAWSESDGAQATWGKRSVRIKVMESHGRETGWRRALIRNLLKLSPVALAGFSWRLALAIGVASVATMLVLRRHRTWYDLLAGTAVICLPGVGPSANENKGT